MDDWLDVGVFHEGEPYLQQHRIRSGKQTVMVTETGCPPREVLSQLPSLPVFRPALTVPEG